MNTKDLKKRFTCGHRNNSQQFKKKKKTTIHESRVSTFKLPPTLALANVKLCGDVTGCLGAAG